MVYRMINTDMKQRALHLLLKEGWGIDQITTALGLLEDHRKVGA